ncbi:MAG: hypothetical protein U0795_26695 [Pirellulales bacterium]
MNVQQFLQHHGIERNPFAEEDAQTDPVFKTRCLENVYHPAWDKIFGEPGDPATAVVFGEKGAGKTAMRLQIAGHLDRYNASQPGKRVFVVHYDDFNPFLDRFRSRLSSRRQRPDRVLAEWRLWDHMDAILGLSVTQLVHWILEPGRGSTAHAPAEPLPVDKLDKYQRRDLLLLAACYDQATAAPLPERWNRLRRTLRYHDFQSWWPWLVGIVVGVLAIVGLVTGWVRENPNWPRSWVFVALFIGGWIPWLWRAARRAWWSAGIIDHVRTGNGTLTSLWKILMRLPTDQIAGQPLPNANRTDDRYEQLAKLQAILATLGYPGMIVLVDRIDEPHLVNGSSEMMRGLVWPLLDNKFLKQPGLGVKLMLPVELMRFIDREEHDFYQRARLDKQNMIPSLEWTGEALYDVANARIRACSAEGKSADLRSLFASSVSDQMMIDGFRRLRVPRHLFKFLYRLLVTHCNSHSEREPVWEIPNTLFDATLAIYLRELDAADKGLGVG